jgi:hypothetical protein
MSASFSLLKIVLLKIVLLGLEIDGKGKMDEVKKFYELIHYPRLIQ